MSHNLIAEAEAALRTIETEGLLKRERTITTPQSAKISAFSESGRGEPQEVLNLCANNYLGLANDPRLIAAAKEALDTHGFGMASVRFICGTQDLHKELEAKLSSFLAMEDTILFSSCFDANGGVFEALLGPEDAVISDALNHASIIDGIRLCKAQRFRYANNDMAELEQHLRNAEKARHRLIVTDGVFSMDGIVANLPAICDLAEKYDALVMVDDSHAVGFMGDRGAGTPEYLGVEERVHLSSGTFGKALGGASGGYIAGPDPIVSLLRQKARPYLFSNSVAPCIVAATIKVLDLLDESSELRDRLRTNASYFRQGLQKAGFDLIPGEHPIIPVMIGDAALAQRFAADLMQHGVYVIAFSFPVVPKGLARIRTQMSAAHTKDDLDRALLAFEEVGRVHKLV